MSSSGRPNPPAKPCPICRKKPVEQYAPFCSKRCSDIDLGRWLNGSYVLPGEQAGDEEGGGTKFRSLP